MKEDIEQIEALNEAFYHAFESGDLDKMSEVWIEDTDDRVAMCVHPGWAMLAGRSSVLRSWALFMANTTYIQFVLSDVRTMLSGDVAVVTCTEDVLVPAGTDELGFAAGVVVATNTFIRTESGWRLWLHHGSPVMQDEDEDEGEGGHEQ
ncbi:3-dehydroquinate dehydratase [Sphaerimonospora thailandensis]|uniref:3-dehydroquinate dehydratase n=2 Tax=Sphaerimonospora thailandensis TaxID=795644 RepID=A0A8J3RAB6_9ACTN|nr:3-dehydroquinate dehydratase [Sphaerimonospora thailandensis]